MYLCLSLCLKRGVKMLPAAAEVKKRILPEALASSQSTRSHSISPTSPTPHTFYQSSFLNSTLPTYPPTLHTQTHAGTQIHTHKQATKEGKRTPNAISTPLSTFVLMNRGGLVIHQAACCCSRTAGSQNIQAA